jgi:hypothetical protein
VRNAFILQHDLQPRSWNDTFRGDRQKSPLSVAVDESIHHTREDHDGTHETDEADGTDETGHALVA